MLGASGAELEDFGGQGVGAAEGGGVEVEDGLVLGLVEGCVDIYEFCWVVRIEGIRRVEVRVVGGVFTSFCGIGIHDGRLFCVLS